MDGVLHIELTPGDVAALLNAADRIYSFIGYAQGEEARYQMRRDQIVVALPLGKKKPRRKRNRERIQSKKCQNRHQVNSKRSFPRCPKIYRKKSNKPF